MLLTHLCEARMSPSQYRRYLTDDFLLGYEIEMVVTQQSNYFGASYNGVPSFNETCSMISYPLSKLLGQPVQYGKDIADADWKIVKDLSIEAGDGVGIELCTPSPPSVLSKSLKQLEDIFQFMKANHIETNESTGFHINMSFPHMEKLDLVKLVVFLDDAKILSDFGRVDNDNTLPVSDEISYAIAQYINIGAKDKLFTMLQSKTFSDWAREELSFGKYQTINFGKLSEGYLEFRSPGGENYHQKFQLLKETIGKIAMCLTIASDPELYKEDYLKKVVRLINKIDKRIETEKINLTFKELLQQSGADFLFQQIENADADSKLQKLVTFTDFMKTHISVKYGKNGRVLVKFAPKLSKEFKDVLDDIEDFTADYELGYNKNHGLIHRIENNVVKLRSFL